MNPGLKPGVTSKDALRAYRLKPSREVFGDAARAEGGDAALAELMSYLAFFLCAVVVALLGLPLLNDALQGLARRRVEATLLIVG